MRKAIGLVVLTVLLLVGVVEAQTIEWRVDYLVRKPAGQSTNFYGDGTYMFLKNNGYVPVYLRNVNWIFIGMDADLTLPAYQAYGVAVYPEGFPDIVSFPAGITTIMVTPIVIPAVIEETTTIMPEPDLSPVRERHPRRGRR